ncbi:unnamed protein product [Polarella glacialis]|uniref:Uncharacterized protein n=1 Tax=Polarella glacialis TaxID=89957 RepID=A0A813D722_POLGL|nr:unnamed protein product [Polarella glacialis]
MEEEAIEREEENVALFEVTCGDDSPLTASALRGLGEAYMSRSRSADAITVFARSYLLEAQKDAFDLLAIMEVHNSLFGAHMAAIKATGALDRTAFRSYMPTVQVALGRVRAMKQDANTGAYYKVSGELTAFAEDYVGATALLGQAIELFKTEADDKVGGLIKHCTELKDFCDSQLAAQAATSSGEVASGEAAK